MEPVNLLLTIMALIGPCYCNFMKPVNQKKNVEKWKSTTS
jgi:hypothetical protein